MCLTTRWWRPVFAFSSAACIRRVARNRYGRSPMVTCLSATGRTCRPRSMWVVSGCWRRLIWMKRWSGDARPPLPAGRRLRCGRFTEGRFIALIKKPHGEGRRGGGAGRGWLGQPGGESLSKSGVRLPPAAEGLVDGYDAAIQLDFCLGLGVFGAQAFAFGVEQYQKVHFTFAVAHAGLFGSGAAGVGLA